MMHSAFAFGADTALILTPSGFPIPPQSYVDAVDNLYLVPHGYATYTPQAVATPEGLYPLTGVKSLPFDTSVTLGVKILDDEINTQIRAGNRVVVFGFSQSSTISSLEMTKLAGSANPPGTQQLSFVLVGDPNNPNGGLLERFDGLTLPSLGVTFSGATPGDIYPTDVYTNEYDGFADFPQYPIDIFSDLNALFGMAYQHATYANLTPQQVNSAIALPTAGNTLTHYYMIPADSLPLLNPLRLIPLIGNPLADLLQPDMTVLVNLGYGSITEGWSQGPANVPTQFGLFPTNINPADLLTALAQGAQQGITDALNDLRTPTFFDTSSLSGLLAAAHTLGLTPSTNPSLLELVNALSTFANGDVPVSSTGIVDALTKVVSTAFSVLLPTADIGLALGASLPAYDVSLFVNQLKAGNLVNAIGYPIAADVGLGTGLVGFEAVVLAEAAATAISELASALAPAPALTAPNGTSEPAPATVSVGHNDLAQLARSSTGATPATVSHNGLNGLGGTGVSGDRAANGNDGPGGTREAGGQGVQVAAESANPVVNSGGTAGSTTSARLNGSFGRHVPTGPARTASGGDTGTSGTGEVRSDGGRASTAPGNTGSNRSTHSTEAAGKHHAHTGTRGGAS